MLPGSNRGDRQQGGPDGGTFLHTSRTRPSHIPKDEVPDHLKEKYREDINDLTPEVLQNLDFLGIDTLIPIGGMIPSAMGSTFPSKELR